MDTGDTDSVPGSGRFPGGGYGNLLQYSCWKNPMDTVGWWATAHGVAETRTQLSRLSTALQGLTKDLCAEKPGMTESGPHGGQRRVLQRGKAVSRRRSRCYCDRSSSGLRDQDMLAEKNVAVACECIPSEGHSWWIWELALKREGGTKLS